MEATKEYLTLGEVAKKYSKTYTQVRYATETKRLPATKVGWMWVYPVKELPDTWPEAPRKAKKGAQ